MSASVAVLFSPYITEKEAKRCQQAKFWFGCNSSGLKGIKRGNKDHIKKLKMKKMKHK